MADSRKRFDDARSTNLAGNSRPKRGVCFSFNKHRRCRFGDACKFSHDLNLTQHRDLGMVQREKRTGQPIEDDTARTKYNSWRCLLRRPPQMNDFYAVQRLWDGALEIVNSDNRDFRQSLPKDLDGNDENGQQHIKALLNARPRVGQYEIFIEISRSFLLTISHSALLHCLSVDTYVGSLYCFISGANGTRAIPFFQHLCDILAATRAQSGRMISTEELDSTLTALSNTLTELLKRERRARYNEDLSNLLESLETAAQKTKDDGSIVTSRVIIKQMEDLRAMISRASGLLFDEEDVNRESHSLVPLRSAYPRQIVIPGGRHDNDQFDVTKIDIFPTQEEILSDAREFLPSTDPDQPQIHTSKVERHIDTHFRLLRHDTFSALKDAIRSLMNNIRTDQNQLKHPKFEFGDTHTYTYSSSVVKYVMFTRHKGLQAQIAFLQPHPTRRNTLVDRREWWEESRRLEEGVLLSFIWLRDAVVKHMFFTVSKRSTDGTKLDSLTHDNRRATITGKLTVDNHSAVEDLIHLSCQRTSGILLEFPHVLPATFVPVLANLQDMLRFNRLPFYDWILPDRVETRERGSLDVPPPLYSQQAGFAFPLTSILKPGAGTMLLEPLSLNDVPSIVVELESKSELDLGQCEALVAALTREFAFIQGPPGTGKSYLGVELMKVLLDTKTEARLGPVFVVCYTNHALDQFLEHLIKNGIRKLIRLGGQSRSDILEGHNLRNIARTESKSKQERWQAANAYTKLDEYEDESRRILHQIHGARKRIEWKNVKQHIAQNYQKIYVQFQMIDDDGFTKVGRHPFDIWANGGASSHPSKAAPTATNLTSIITKAGLDAQSLSRTERGILLELWGRELQQNGTEEFIQMISDANDTRRDLTNIHEELNRRLLQDADVVGLTTTGLAKNVSTLQHVRAKVIICEEAGEVMEPHIISALLPTVEHFIQIGDHQQLRPSINNFQDLSLESDQGILYQLDRSQFERLSLGSHGRPSMPVAQLNVQRRMRPEISNLIRETIYDKLVDHPSTLEMPDVVGMRKNVFWLDHDNKEDRQQAEIHHSRSKSNEWETKMIHALVRHIVRQGVYASTDIAVLTPYTGQLQKLRAVMRNDFEIIISERDQDSLVKDGFGVQNDVHAETSIKHGDKRKPLQKKKLSELLRIATIDNFQGEEAKIVIISLTRSNPNRKVGFLRTTNRINVLLSRAQHGMYIIGNVDTYLNVPMWQKVINNLRASDSLGRSLELCCPRHKDTLIQVQQPDDFAKFSPEGGCREACMDRLPDCGHRCQARCHSKAMHEVFICEKSCQRRHKPCDHPCQKPTCGVDCGKCMIVLNSVQLPCGHFHDNVFCYRIQNLNAIKCNITVSKVVARCGHTIQAQCCQDVNTDSYGCPHRCETMLNCGHPCPGSCGGCNRRNPEGVFVAEHSECTKPCARRFGTCNHTCSQNCHVGKDCGLCLHQCEVACKHSRCSLKCHEACAPCVERCAWSCPHEGDCTMPCSAPCNRLPCNERCSKLLHCGHQCPGLCGEYCLPDYCKECKMRLDSQVDMIEFKKYQEIDLDETPIVALGCGHFFTAETLDGMIGLKEVYKIDHATGEILGLQGDCSKMAPAVPKCPHCQRPIQQYVTQRYNRLINRAVIDEISKRFIVTGQADLQEIHQKTSHIEAELEKAFQAVEKLDVGSSPKSSSNRGIRNLKQKLQTRYEASEKLRLTILQLQDHVAKRHQPVNKLHEAIIHAQQQDSILESAMSNLKLEPKQTLIPSARDHRIILGAKMAEVKLEYIMIEDKFRVFSTMKAKHGDSITSQLFARGSPQTLADTFLQSCADFITTCSNKMLPKLAVETSIYYARVARLYETSGMLNPEDREKAIKYHDTAKALLEMAEKQCGQGFTDADVLLRGIQESLKLLQKHWYEGVTAEELESIKSAMVSGPRGIATHSGHWYNCVNGHPFAIGECGMPMERARCPECGASIGGQNHEAVQGVTRAETMEH